VTRPGRAETLALLAILAIAVALRAWGVAFGLPHIYHPDEGFEVYRALRLGTGGFDLERTGKGGLYFLLFLEYGAYFVALRLAGVVHGAGEFAQRFAADPSAFWLLGRWTNVILGAATVALAAFQARRIAGPRAGLLAALFLACSAQHVVDSHYVTVDVPMTLFAFLAVVLVAEDATGRARLHPVGFAAAAAFAMLNKIPAGLVFVPYLLGIVLRDGLRGPRGLLRPATLGPPLLAAALFALANPGIWLQWHDTVAMFREALGGGRGAAAPAADAAAPANLWAFYGGRVLASQGGAGLVLAAAGLLAGLARRCRATALHATFAAAFFVLIAGSSSTHLYYDRYILPVLPGLSLLAALGLDDFLRRRLDGTRWAGAVAAAVALLVVASPLQEAVRFDRRMSRTDTRTEALEWVRARVPGGSRVLLEGNPEDAAQLTIPLPPGPQLVARMVEDLRNRDPGKAAFWELKQPTLPEPTYELVAVDHRAVFEPLPVYEALGVDWAVLPLARFTGTPDPRYRGSVMDSRHRLREALLASEGWRREAAFRAGEDRPGPDLEIWRRVGAGLPGS